MARQRTTARYAESVAENLFIFCVLFFALFLLFGFVIGPLVTIVVNLAFRPIDDWMLRGPARTAASEVEYRETTPPDIVVANPADFPWLDVSFYDETEAELSRLGFRLIGDFEDVTESKLHPAFQRFHRFMYTDRGEILASICIMPVIRSRLSGLERISSWFMRTSVPKIEMFSKTYDQLRITTANVNGLVAKEAMDYPGVIAELLPRETGAGDLYKHHRDTVEAIEQADPKVKWRRCFNMDRLRRLARNEHFWMRDSGLYRDVTEHALANLEGQPEPFTLSLVDRYRTEQAKLDRIRQRRRGRLRK